MSIVIFIILTISSIFSFSCRNIAYKKGYSQFAFFILGYFFSIITFLILCLLPPNSDHNPSKLDNVISTCESTPKYRKLITIILLFILIIMFFCLGYVHFQEINEYGSNHSINATIFSFILAALSPHSDLGSNLLWIFYEELHYLIIISIIAIINIISIVSIIVLLLLNNKNKKTLKIISLVFVISSVILLIGALLITLITNINGYLKASTIHYLYSYLVGISFLILIYPQKIKLILLKNGDYGSSNVEGDQEKDKNNCSTIGLKAESSQTLLSSQNKKKKIILVSSFIGTFFILAIILSVVLTINKNPLKDKFSEDEQSSLQISVDYVSKNLKDPSSLKIRKIYFYVGKIDDKREYLVWIEYNAKNSYGAYAGYTDFYLKSSSLSEWMVEDYKNFSDFYDDIEMMTEKKEFTLTEKEIEYLVKKRKYQE